MEVEQKAKPFVQRRTVIAATPLVPGVSCGAAFQYRDVMTRQLHIHNLEEGELIAELERIRSALKTVDGDLGQMKRKVEKQVNASQAAVFDVHRAILKDLALVQDIEAELEERMVNAEHVVRDVFKRWEKKFKTADSVEVQSKAADIADIGRRLLHALMGVESNVLKKIPPNSVIFAPRLLPSDTVHLDSRRVSGIVTQEAGHNSHATVLARALNIPLVSKVGERLNEVRNGTQVILNGDTGEIILHPEASEYRRILEQLKKAHKEEIVLAEATARASSKIEGKQVRVRANISTLDDARLARRFCCDGVGLYRIEQIYMSGRSLPTESDLYHALSASLSAVADKEITVRLLDVGADKTLPYLNITDERDSVMGIRGVRLLLHFPHLLETQLRALLSLSAHFKVRILIPMVTLADEVAAVKAVLEKEMEKLRKEKKRFDAVIPIGSMIETPAAAVAVDEILPLVDFISFGTNDLVQFLMVADRENLSVSKYYEAGERYVLKWIREIISKARKAGVECELCGELAGDLDVTKKLIQAGLRDFSVTPHLIPALRTRIGEIAGR